MLKHISLCCGLALLLTTTACDSKSKEAAAPAAPATETAQVAPAAESAAPAVRKGKIVETADAAGYTYMLIDDGGKQEWIAIPQTTLTVGEEVSFYDGLVMENFHSKSLNRDFEKIIFSNGLVGAETTTVAAPAPAADQGDASFENALKAEGGTPAAGAEAAQAMGSKKAVVPFAEIKVDKASGENSYTVGEIFAKAAELNGKAILVKGKVVKVSPKIMGRTWLHIQDGSGDPAQQTHDLVVTTLAEPEADWDIVTVAGTLNTDKDFGAGYFYKVIVEEATVSK